MTTYRFNFSKNFQEKILKFAKIHEGDELIDFNDYFSKWCKENNNFIENELKNLKERGYQGNIIDKVFKSIRYYFKNKTIGNVESKKRKKYTVKNSEFLNTIKEHINSIRIVMKPSEAYNQYAELYKDEIKKMKSILIENEYDEKESIKKIKKIYKNKYFIYQKSKK